MHPNGQIPAYEWAFGDVNPPVHAWAALRVFEIDGRRDHEFLARVFHKLLLNFTWWVNRKDARRQQRLRGRLPRAGQHRPVRPLGGAAGAAPAGAERRHAPGWRITRSTCWRSRWCSPSDDRSYEDIATKFFEHFAYIAAAHARDRACGTRRTASSTTCSRSPTAARPLRVRSMVGLLPLAAADRRRATARPAARLRRPAAAGSCSNKPEYPDAWSARRRSRDGLQRRLLAVVDGERLVRDARRAMLDEDEFLSPYGLRSLSRRHRDQPFALDLGGTTSPSDYEPGESTTGLFGGNSNWRGPIWFPVNYLVIEALRRFAGFYGDDLHRRAPDRLGRPASRWPSRRRPRRTAGRDRSCDDADGRRPVFGGSRLFQSDPRLARPAAVPRVLPRRHRRRARRLAPDRLDRARGGSRAPHARRAGRRTHVTPAAVTSRARKFAESTRPVDYLPDCHQPGTACDSCGAGPGTLRKRRGRVLRRQPIPVRPADRRVTRPPAPAHLPIGARRRAHDR